MRKRPLQLEIWIYLIQKRKRKKKIWKLRGGRRSWWAWVVVEGFELLAEKTLMDLKGYELGWWTGWVAASCPFYIFLGDWPLNPSVWSYREPTKKSSDLDRLFCGFHLRGACIGRCFDLGIKKRRTRKLYNPPDSATCIFLISLIKRFNFLRMKINKRQKNQHNHSTFIHSTLWSSFEIYYFSH